MREKLFVDFSKIPGFFPAAVAGNQPRQDYTLFAPSDGGPLLSGCHPLLINGEWQLACKACPSAGSCTEVFNFALDIGHVIEVDGVWCGTLQHDVDDDWGNTMLPLLQRQGARRQRAVMAHDRRRSRREGAERAG